jgi:hypothetical protein
MSKPTLQERLVAVWNTALPMLNEYYPASEWLFSAFTPTGWDKDSLTLTLTTSNPAAYNVMSHPSWRGVGDVLMALMKQEQRVALRLELAKGAVSS